MFGTYPIGNFSGLLAAAAASCVGFAAIWSYPKRRINRVFFSLSLHVSLWLISRTLASALDNLMLARVTTAIGGLTHFHLWLVKETLADSKERLLHKIRRGRWWLTVNVALGILCFTEWFIHTPALDDLSRGRQPATPAFILYYVALFVLFAVLCTETVRQIRVKIGVQRLELQLLLFGGSATAITVILFRVLTMVLGASWIAQLVPYVVMIFYVVTAVAITRSRVFDAQQIFRVVLHKLCLVTTVTVLIYFLNKILNGVFSEQIAILLTVAIALWVSDRLNQWLDSLFQYYQKASSARQAVYLVAQEQRQIDALIDSFSNILKGWGHTDRALISTANKKHSDSGAPMADESAVFPVMRQLQWATPERLTRERPTAERETVAEFLSQRDIGVLVIAEGMALSVLVGVGVGASRQPYTYPQVTELMELASIMGSAIERAHFSAKIQHTEQLATVGLLGASLAHEIRNPLVSIKTFVQLLPKHYQDAAFRDKFFRLISDEVGRIDQLTEQLLDLSSPRAYVAQKIDLHPLLQASVELVSAKAAHRQIDVITEFGASPDVAFTDAAAAKQVILNLCFNAVQAVDNHPGHERWVKVSTRNTNVGIELAVSDSGPGISAEIRPRLFQPFQTTKSTGFGLGLAICSDILANLDASISVDSSELGRGATFRVTFPCQPS